MSVRNEKQFEGAVKHSEVTQLVSDLFYFFREMKIVPVYFFLSVICSFVSVLFNFLGLKLLIPLLKGLLQNNFMSVSDRIGVVKFVATRFPNVFNNSMAFFLLLIAIIFFSVIMKNLLNYFSALSVGQEIRKADANIRKLVMGRYLSFGKLYFDRANAMSVSHIMVNAANGVVGQLGPLQKMLSQILSLITYLAIMFWISWKLTLIAMVIFPVFQFSTDWLVRSVQGVTRAHEVLRLSLLQRIGNVISRIPLVKMYSTQEREETHLFHVSDEEIRMAFQMEKKQQLVRPIQDIGTMASLLLMVWAMVLMMPSESAHSVSKYLVFFYVMRMAMPNFGLFANFRMSLATAETQIAQLHDILMSEEGKYLVKSGSKVFDGLKKSVEFRDLKFSYRVKREVLRGVTFSFEKGQMTAIVGPTGAGKTTLAHLLVRLYECPSGAIFVDGTDIQEYRIKSLVARMALVSQDPMLFNDTLRANITYGLEGSVSDERLAAALRKAKLDELVAKLPEGLETLIGDRGAQLSGGEKQRVSIARAFLKEAEILILDEATSAMDTKTERSIQQAIDESIKENTVLVIAHRLSTIVNADKVVVIEDGRVAEQGTPAVLMEKQGKFYEYWQAQKIRESNFLNGIGPLKIEPAPRGAVKTGVSL